LLQTKFAASSVLPLPVYRATDGYAQSGRERTVPDSIVVFGKETVAKLSNERTGLALGIASSGLAIPGPAPRPAAAPRP
jgi:hypothetical protein